MSGFQLDIFPKTEEKKKTEHIPLTICSKQEQLRELYEQFLPYIKAIHQQGIRSSCPCYWRSRFSDFIAHTHGDSWQVWQEKKQKESLWEPFYKAYHTLMHQAGK